MEHVSVVGKRGDEAFAYCVANDGYPVSLQLHKFYRVLPDEKAKRYGEIRIVDESGEDYLYPAEYCLPIELPKRPEIGNPRAWLASGTWRSKRKVKIQLV
jgi:hypothetical protein